MRALVVKEFRELARDRRTLAMLIVLPVLLLVIFGYAANFSVDRVSVIMVGSEAEALADELDGYDVAGDDLDILRIDPALSADDAEALLRDQEADAVIVAESADDVAAVVFLFVVLGIGVLISSVSQNTGQAIQMAILFVVPQVLLSGLIFPLDSMPIGVRWIGYVLPLTWFREIAQGVMLRDAGLDTLWLPLAILTVMAVVAFGAATARMRFSLTHGGAR